MSDPHVPIYQLLPTRNRPEGLRRAVESLKGLARHPDRVRILLAVDEDDTTDYSAYDLVKRRPRLGYGGLHVYWYELARWAVDLDVAGPAGWQSIWNDDMVMLTQDWDEKLVAYGPEPKVVFQRRDMYPADSAYPAWPRSLFETTKSLGEGPVDVFLRILTTAADRLIGYTVTHIHAPEIVVQHNRVDPDPASAFPMPTREDTPDVKGIGFEAAVFKLAYHYGAMLTSPFGWKDGVPIRRTKPENWP